MTSKKLKVENWPIEKLIPYVRNPRKNDHAVERVAAAIREFGFRVPIVAKSDGLLVDGHLRLKAAQKLGLTEVPVILADDMTEAQIKAFRISVNRMAELAEWDNELLALEFAELKELGFDTSLTGFDNDMLAEIMPPEKSEPLTDEDAVPEVEDAPVVKRGDTWILGNHRLRCGDSTSAEDVALLMSGEKADMVFTDPPYGMFLNTDYDSMFAIDSNHRKTGNRFTAVIGDNDDFKPELVSTIFKHFSNTKEIFIWGADYFSELLPNRKDGSWIVWDKRCNENMDKVSGNTFELCYSKQKHKRLIARIMWSGHHGMQKDDTKKRVHPTQKPVELVTWFFEHWGNEIKSVVDLFGGSGSTLIACEKTGRKCFMMELDEKYVQVIIKRWQEYTGKDAYHAETGETFNSLAAK